MLARESLTFTEENKGEAEAALADLGAKMMLAELEKFELGTPSERVKQDDALSNYAAKIEKEDCKLNFTKAARELDFNIRGVTPIPGAFAYLNGKMLKITKARVTSGKGNAGEVIDVNGNGTGSFTVACGDGALEVLAVIPEGKGKMSAGDFVRGRKIVKGDVLS
jgi:methionyl-tRNA formyltransferase